MSLLNYPGCSGTVVYLQIRFKSRADGACYAVFCAWKASSSESRNCSRTQECKYPNSPNQSDNNQSHPDSHQPNDNREDQEMDEDYENESGQEGAMNDHGFLFPREKRSTLQI